MPVGCLSPGQGSLLSGQIDLAQVLEQNGRGDDADNPQWVCTGISVGDLRTRIADLSECLTGCTETRGVCDSTAQDSHHHRKILLLEQAQPQNDHYGDVQQDRTRSHEVHGHSALAETGEEGRTDLKSYAEHEQDKAEVLDKINYLEIAGEAEMSHKDTDKQSALPVKNSSPGRKR